MLSREVATSMRGPALEVTVYLFSFRESLAHRNAGAMRHTTFAARPVPKSTSMPPYGRIRTAPGIPLSMV